MDLMEIAKAEQKYLAAQASYNKVADECIKLACKSRLRTEHYNKYVQVKDRMDALRAEYSKLARLVIKENIKTPAVKTVRNIFKNSLKSY